MRRVLVLAAVLGTCFSVTVAATRTSAQSPAASAGLAASGSPSASTPVSRVPVVTVTPAHADVEFASELTLTGSGFQSIEKGFGGIYVLFGTVTGDWRPSQGGQSGLDYVYVQDVEQRDNQGFQKFVTFPGSSTAFAANGGELAADGTWSTTIIVPGPSFRAVGRNGEIREIDCRVVQCGVLTIGAHGVVNPENETFTPIDFVVPPEPLRGTHVAGLTAGVGLTSVIGGALVGLRRRRSGLPDPRTHGPGDVR